MKRIYKPLVIMLTAALLIVLGMPVHASKMDSRIEKTARQSYIFKTFLQYDDIKIESKDGNVTLTGIVADNFNKSLAGETMASIAGVRSVDNRLEIKGSSPIANSDAWLHDKVKGTLMFHMTIEVPKTKDTI